MVDENRSGLGVTAYASWGKATSAKPRKEGVGTLIAGGTSKREV